MHTKDENHLDDDLRRARPGPEFPEKRIRARIRETIAARDDSRVAPRVDPVGWLPGRLGAAGRAALLAAASLVIFVAGTEFGRRTVDSTHARGASPPAGGELELPLSIQHTGSEYVASLAGLTARGETLSPEQRRLAEEVALTVLHAAIVELGRAADDDRVLRTAAGLVSAQRSLVLWRGPPAPRAGNGS